MNDLIVPPWSSHLIAWPGGRATVPRLFADAGPKATMRFIEFFTANIRNPNTRASYARAVWKFDGWCQSQGLPLELLSPIHVATYIEQLGTTLSKPSVKQSLAALRMLFDFLVVGQVIATNPAASVRGPKYIMKKGKSPVLSAEDTRLLFDSIETTTVIGLRDRALIATMAYSFSRVSATLGMNIEDYYQMGRRSWIRLHEKGGKLHEVPAHHNLIDHLDAYLDVAPTAAKHPLFRSITRKRTISEDRLERREALAMVKRRCVAAGLGDRYCNHTFRATGITVYLENGGTIEKAQTIAAHESPRTTKLYDRTSDEVTLDEIERIRY